MDALSTPKKVRKIKKPNVLKFQKKGGGDTNQQTR